jgi:tetratricopeptide (TPR) repeat protein
MARRDAVGPLARARALCAFSDLLSAVDRSRAIAAGDEALALARALGAQREIALALIRCADNYFFTSNHRVAPVLAAEGVELARHFGTAGDVALATVTLGRVRMFLGDHAAGRAQMQEGLALLHEVGNAWLASFSEAILGLDALRRGDYAQGRALHQASLAVKRRLRLKRGIAFSTWALGLVAEHDGDLATAEDHYRDSLRLYHEAGDLVEIGRPLLELARAEVAPAPERAARLFGAGFARLGRARPTRLDDVPWPGVVIDGWAAVEAARTALGEAKFEADWADGERMSEQEAFDYAQQGRA